MDDSGLSASIRRLLILLSAVVALLAVILWCLWKTDTGFAPRRKALLSPGEPSPAAVRPHTTPAGSPAPRPIPSATPSHPPGENGADLYKHAFELFGALTEEEKNMLAHPRDEVDADKAAGLFAKIQPIMELLRQAKDAAYVDWALGPLRYDSPMPQMNLVMKLGQLARWSAAYRFPTDQAGAITDLSAQASLGHSVGRSFLIGFLVKTSLDAGAIDLLRSNAATLTPETFVPALNLLRSMNVTENLAQAMATEAELPRGIAEDLANPQTHAKPLRALTSIMSDDAAAERTSAAQSATIATQADWLAQVEKDFTGKALLSDEEFNTWWAGVTQAAETQPFAKVALPALNATRDRLKYVTLQNTMLTAGLSILQGGSDQLPTVNDPTTGQPFTYVPSATGFELRSTFQYKKKPVTMSFPTPTPK